MTLRLWLGAFRGFIYEDTVLGDASTSVKTERAGDFWQWNRGCRRTPRPWTPTWSCCQAILLSQSTVPFSPLNSKALKFQASVGDECHHTVNKLKHIYPPGLHTHLLSLCRADQKEGIQESRVIPGKLWCIFFLQQMLLETLQLRQGYCWLLTTAEKADMKTLPTTSPLHNPAGILLKAVAKTRLEHFSIMFKNWCRNTGCV